MKSMTGFGLGSHQSSGIRIEVSIRCVNGRFLETRFHIPRELISFESEIRKRLGQSFSRGTLDLFITRNIKGLEGAQNLVLNKNLAKSYLKAHADLQKLLPKKSQSALGLSAEHLLRMPEVVKVENSNELTKHEKDGLFDAIEMAIEACQKERAREGQSLAKDLLGTVHILSERVHQIEILREEVNQSLLAKMQERLKTKWNFAEIEPARLAQECVLHLEKSDINEELARLKEHLKNYQELLSSKEPQGKKLDFYTQELLREVNTIGSKSGVAKLTEIVVECKTSIERLREQVQNVE